MKQWIFFISVLVLAVTPLKAQELNCTVTVNASAVEGTSTQVFKILEGAIMEFMNTRRWTDMTIESRGEVDERIECSINLLVKEYSVGTDRFDNVEVTIQSRRPVYGSSYTTTVLNILDKEVNFDYKESDRLDYVENMFTSNLSSLLAYYAYIIIGYDADTYSRLGGSPYFRVAENIVLSGQSSDFKGWQAYQGDAFRYTLANNLMDEAFKKLRNFMYDYHRLALDQMVDNVVNARNRIAEGIPLVREANRARPMSKVVTVFMDSKSDEIASIFTEGSTEQRQQIYDIMMDIAPTRGMQFEKMIKSN